MSRSLTAVRLMSYAWGVTPTQRNWEAGNVLVIPYNPAARLAMIRRTVKTLWPRAKGKARERREAQVLFILGTALTPS